MRCARCHELIEPGESWQLDHKDDGHGWLGASHERCNGRAGWEKMVEQNARGGQPAERPYRWARRWHEAPPVGTEVYVAAALWRCMSAAGCGGPWSPNTTSSLALDRPRLACAGLDV